jgi:fumarylpyruvate hydrolase
MMTQIYAFPAPAQPFLPIIGSESVFPVRRIFCIGRNYAAHSREMGGDPTREPPFFFQKAADTIQICPLGQIVDHPYPPMTSNYHFEAEMVVALHQGGRDIKEATALDHVFGYAVGVDMTRRDRQDEAKSLKRPWEIAKSADFSAPIGPLHPASQVGHIQKGAITLSVNGDVKQNANLSDMIWSVPEQITILSTYFELKAGDLIFSGTPEGVGAVTRGDVMNVAIATLGNIELRVV